MACGAPVVSTWRPAAAAGVPSTRASVATSRVSGLGCADTGDMAFHGPSYGLSRECAMKVFTLFTFTFVGHKTILVLNFKNADKEAWMLESKEQHLEWKPHVSCFSQLYEV